jgi:peptidoglycan/LPS O-acetylase OafA/YrhL
MNDALRHKAAPYRPDIDGLRAVAVIAVIAGHAFEGWFPGGYLGVDVFFVISGFVITHSLLARGDARFGAFAAAFSLRRIKRLLPALLVCVALTCMVLLFLDPTPKTSLLTGAAALFGVSNFSMYFQELDYFSPSVRFNAFTHTWSLGVEEQFYLLFPLIYWFAFRPSHGRNIRRLLFVILAFSFASLVGFILLQISKPMAAYYMMPLRFWELGFGVAAAAILTSYKDARPKFYQYLNPAILILALAVVFILPIHQQILRHVIVVVLTTLLLLIGAGSDRQSRLLTNAPTRYVGRISYSLYLWHWPFLAFGLLSSSGILANPIVSIICAFCVAALSYQWVEQPVRHFRTPRPRVWHFAAALLSICVVIASITAGNNYRKSVGLKPIETALRPDFYLLPGSNLPFNPTCVVDGQSRLLHADTFEKCTFLPTPGSDRQTLWVMGDSHAGHLQGGLIKLREAYGYGVHLIETPGNTFPVINPQGFPPRDILYQEVQKNWKPGDVVVLSRLYLSRSTPLQVRADVAGWLKMVDALASDLDQSGINLLLVGPSPMFSFEDIRSCVPADATSCAVERSTLEGVIGQVHLDLMRLAARHQNTGVLETFPILCPEHARLCSPTKDGVFLFRDRDHLNIKGAAFLNEAFRAALSAFVKRP